MRVAVDRDKCQGHARCEAMAEILTVDDDGYSDIGDDLEIPAEAEHEVRAGVAACPERALRILED